MTLVEVLLDPIRKAAVVRDGVLLIEDEVGRKRGITGMALKAGYKTVRKIKPGIIGEALGSLLPHFAPAVDPFYAKAREHGDVRGYFVRHADGIAEALLTVTDAKAKGAQNRVMLRAYRSLRGQAKGHVVEAIPGLAVLIERHVGR